MSTCKTFDFWPCNPSVSGRGGSGPGRQSGMPRECTCMTARDEAHSQGGCILYVEVLGATAIDDVLAIDQVISTFLLSVGDCTGLLGVIVERISKVEIGTSHCTDEQRAAVAAGTTRHPS